MSEINIFLSQNLSTVSSYQPKKERRQYKKESIEILKSQPFSKKEAQANERSPGQCIVCLTQKVYGKFTECQHEVICSRCAQNYLISSIQNNQVPTCLLLFCKAPVNINQSMFRNFSENTHSKWKAFQLKSSIKMKTQQSILHCQKPDCQGYIDPATDICQICQQKHCKQCHRMFHQGQCLGISTNIDGFQGIKFCKFCAIKLYKEGGCPKIVCSGCKKTICFQCLSQWSISHHGCAQYGWFSFLSNYFSECCSANTVVRQQMFTQFK